MADKIMTDALQRFLEKRARSDYELLRGIVDISAVHTATYDFTTTSLMCTFKGPPAELAISAQDVRFAARFGMALAGEAAKKLERSSPDLIDKYPDFPWIALKRMRDMQTHSARDNFVKSYETADKTYGKEQSKLASYADEHWDPSTGIPNNCEAMLHEDPLVLPMFEGLLFNAVLEELCVGKGPDDPVSLVSAHTSHVARGLKVPPSHFPLMVQHALQTNLLNALADSALMVSSFYKETKNSPIMHDRVGDIIKTRNQLAHFSMLLGEKKFDSCGLAIFDKVTRFGGSVGHALEKLDSNPEQAIATLAATYEARLGNTAQSPAGRALLNRSAEWITHHSKGNSQLEDAYVSAVAQLVSRTTPEIAGNLLDFIEKSPKSLRNSGELEAQLAACPQEQRHVGRAFYTNFKARMPQQDARGVA